MNRVFLDGTDVTMIGVEDFLRREPGRLAYFNSQMFRAEDLPPQDRPSNK